jgi:hypothetical protein
LIIHFEKPTRILGRRRLQHQGVRLGLTQRKNGLGNLCGNKKLVSTPFGDENFPFKSGRMMSFPNSILGHVATLVEAKITNEEIVKVTSHAHPLEQDMIFKTSSSHCNHSPIKFEDEVGIFWEMHCSFQSMEIRKGNPKNIVST